MTPEEWLAAFTEGWDHRQAIANLEGLRRQRIGIEKAKLAGKYKGRTPTAQNQGEEVLRLWGLHVTFEAIAKRLQMSEASAYRIIRDAKLKLTPEVLERHRAGCKG